MGNIGTAQIHLRCFIEKKDNYRIAAEWDICRSSGSLQAEDPAKQVLYRKYPFTTFPFHDTLWKSQALCLWVLAGTRVPPFRMEG